jgi:hypothetical protein
VAILGDGRSVSSASCAEVEEESVGSRSNPRFLLGDGAHEDTVVVVVVVVNEDVVGTQKRSCGDDAGGDAVDDRQQRWKTTRMVEVEDCSGIVVLVPSHHDTRDVPQRLVEASVPLWYHRPRHHDRRTVEKGPVTATVTFREAAESQQHGHCCSSPSPFSRPILIPIQLLRMSISVPSRGQENAPEQQ